MESNHRHTDFQSVALPTELSGRGDEEGQNYKKEIFLDFRSSIKSKFLEILREQVMFEGLNSKTRSRDEQSKKG